MDAAEVSRDYFAAYNARDTARLRRLLADAFRQVRAGGTLVIEGPDDYVAFLEQEWRQRPDATIEIRRVVTTDSGALVEAVWMTTSSVPITLPNGHTLEPTGQHAAMPFVAVFDVEDGIITNDAMYYDTLYLWRSLGHTVSVA